MTKAKQFSLVLCCVFSLFVSSLSACWCADESVSRENHCSPQNSTSAQKAERHSGSHHSHQASENNHHESASETDVYSVRQTDECCCIQSAPKVYAKSEGLKIQKQSVLLTALAAAAEVKLLRQTKVGRNGIFSMPFYLSDSFYNLSPGRAPPVL